MNDYVNKHGQTSCDLWQSHHLASAGRRRTMESDPDQPVWKLHLLQANFANPFPGLLHSQPPGSSPRGALTKKTELSLARARG